MDKYPKKKNNNTNLQINHLKNKQKSKIHSQNKLGILT